MGQISPEGIRFLTENESGKCYEIHCYKENLPIFKIFIFASNINVLPSSNLLPGKLKQATVSLVSWSAIERGRIFSYCCLLPYFKDYLLPEAIVVLWIS